MTDVDSDSTTSASYAEIARLVESKRLALTFIFGPPRGGTTASERWMFDTFNFDGNVNQPGLMARDEVGGRDRIEATWANVLSKYNEVSVGKPEDKTIRLIVKETSNVVLPKSELGLWQKVSQCVLLVFRNPILQIESRICCILNRISSGATADLGVPPDLDPRTITIGGHPLIKPDTDFSFLDENSEVSLWEQYYKHMKKSRDYTSLDYGFCVFSTLHPLFEEPQIQEEALKLYQRNHPQLNISDEDIKSCVGKKLEDIAGLPSFFHDAFHSWRFGWSEFAEQVNVLFKNTEKEGYCKNIGLVDMTDLQASSKFFFDILKPLVGYEPKPVSTEEGLEEKQEAPAHAFDVTSQGEAWDTWFLSSCDWDNIDATSDIRPPTKSIVSYGNFPPFLAEELEFSLDKFCELKTCNLGIQFKVPIKVLRKFYGVDIMQDYINEAIFFDPEEMKRVQANTNDFGYLSMLKKSLLKAGIVVADFIQESEVPTTTSANFELSAMQNKNSTLKILGNTRQRSAVDCQQSTN